MRSRTALRQLAVKAFGPSLKYTVIPRIAKDAGIAESTVRSYLYFRGPSKAFERKVMDLYGWDIELEPVDDKKACVLPTCVSQDIHTIFVLAREVEKALRDKDGYRAKCLHTRLAARLYETFTNLGFLSECIMHADLSAIFTMGREKTLEGVLAPDSKQRVIFTLVAYTKEGRKQSPYKLKDTSQVAELFTHIWGA